MFTMDETVPSAPRPQGGVARKRLPSSRLKKNENSDEARCEKGSALILYPPLAFVERLAKARFDLVSLTEKIDTTTANGKLTFCLRRGLVRRGRLHFVVTFAAEGRMRALPLVRNLLVCFALLLVSPSVVIARDAARDLKRMIGYTIVDASYVEDVLESRSGWKYVKLANGTTFKVDLMLLDPLPMIVFAKAVSKDLYLVKLLIDNEVYDAQPVK